MAQKQLKYVLCASFPDVSVCSRICSHIFLLRARSRTSSARLLALEVRAPEHTTLVLLNERI